MTDQHDEQPSSLLRRVLHEDQTPRVPETGAPESVPPAPAPEPAAAPHPSPLTPPPTDAPRSPIRPTVPATANLAMPLTPAPPHRTPTERQLTPREQMQRAEEALITLRQKMAKLAAEFAEGTLNQAQFDAIYARYSEQRDITERLLVRDPASQAWQSVVRPGHTQFLKQQFAARLLSYAIYDHATLQRIAVTGKLQLHKGQVSAVLQRLQAVITQRGNPGPAQRLLPDGKCVLIVPGELTTAVVIFSLQPAAGQVARVLDSHRDFERANRRALHSHDYQADRLVFPHRALFEAE